MKLFYWNSKKYLGFNDWPLIFVGLPAVSFLIPFVFFNSDPNNFGMYCKDWGASIFFTSIFWIVNRSILIYFHKRFPDLEDNRKRIVLQMIAITVGTIATTELIDIAKAIAKSEPWVLEGIQKHTATLLTSYFIATVYETIYLGSRWQRAQHETERLKKEQLQSQLNVLKSQVNPHFLFNSLNTLVSLIPEEPKQAIDFVQNLSKVYRRILEVREKELISVEEELECLESFQFLVKTRFGDNLRFEINVEKPTRKKFLVPLSLQILMENAVKHNVISRSKPLTISIFENGDGRLVVENNLQPKTEVLSSTKTGLSNINNRCLLVCNESVEVVKTERSFRVLLPLIEISHYANSHR